MRRVQLEPAHLLNARPYRETSALLEVITAQHGRVGLVARGARGPKSRMRGLLQPFQPLLLSWSDAGELGTLTGAESAGPGAGLQGEAVFSGWYLNELLLRLLQRRDPHPALYEGYVRALAGLATDAARALRVFELQLLSDLGYAIQLDEVTADRWYGYDPEAGLRVAEPGPNTYAGTSLRELAAETLTTESSRRDARRLLRSALRPHLGERALRTPELLRALRAATGTGE